MHSVRVRVTLRSFPLLVYAASIVNGYGGHAKDIELGVQTPRDALGQGGCMNGGLCD
jgi:hypothetical protein